MYDYELLATSSITSNYSLPLTAKRPLATIIFLKQVLIDFLNTIKDGSKPT